MYNICKIHVQYCFVQYTVHILQNEIFYEMTYNIQPNESKCYVDTNLDIP